MGALLSAQWFRVADLRPRLDSELRVERVSYRRRIWHLLVRADGTRSFRLNGPAYAFVGRCTGKLGMQRLWELLLAEFGDDAPTQDELLRLVARLRHAGLLQFDRRADFGPPGAADPELESEAAAGARNTLLSFRLPLGRPDRWLAPLAARTRWLFHPAVLLLAAAAIAAGIVTALLEASALAAEARLWMDTPRMLTLAWVVYPVVKLLHELAHALVLRHHGGRVPEWGVNLMMFTPIPYVDASAASALPSAAQRASVSLAGIGVELLLAALALPLALQAEPGLLRDLAWVVFFVGGVSTLLVNGNPLLRFDGYHALCDAAELPNLAPRSARWWLERLGARVLGVAPAEPLVAADGERAWLWAYAPAALAWRIGAGLALIGWLAQLSFVLGAAIALYLGWVVVARPLWALARWLHGSRLADADRTRATRRSAALAALLAGAVVALPLPHASLAQGIVWLPEQAQVRNDTEGIIDSVEVADGAPVRAGQLLFRLGAPQLQAEAIRLEAQLTALQAQRGVALRADPARAGQLEQELARAAAELERLRERLAGLDVRAGVDGIVAIRHAEDLPGRYAKRGSLLAQVLTADAPIVRAAIPQEEAALVRSDTRAISVRLAEPAAAGERAELLRDLSGATTRLPGAALGDRAGGRIVTDPRDAGGLTAAQGVVLADLQLPERRGAPAGARAWVRFDHGWAPLAVQAARRAQQLFLKHFNPSQ